MTDHRAREKLRAQLMEHWKWAVDNQAKLIRCPRPHDFSKTELSSDGGRVRWHVCIKCGGSVTPSNARFYRMGMKDAHLERLRRKERKIKERKNGGEERPGGDVPGPGDGTARAG